MAEGINAENRYAALKRYRDIPLERAYTYAEYTLPSLLPREGHNDATQLKYPWAALGGEGVQHLASLHLLTLFPPGAPFFRMSVNKMGLRKALDAIQDAPQISDEDLDRDIERADSKLAEVGNSLHKHTESNPLRVGLSEGLQHLTVAGNVLLYIPKEADRLAPPDVFPMDSYVVRRTRTGKVMEIVIKEEIFWDELDDDVQGFLSSEQPHENRTETKRDEPLDLYTWIRWDGKKYQRSQEMCCVQIPDTEETYDEEEMPYAALLWEHVPGQHWGRGYIERLFPDLKVVNALTKATMEAAAGAADTRWRASHGVTPASRRSLRDDPPGSVIVAEEGQIESISRANGADLQVTASILADKTRKLEMAFLRSTSIQRDGERVTAEEIRLMARELETTLGGVYASLAVTLQMTIMRRILSLYDFKEILGSRAKKGKIPTDIISASVTTGINALGSSHQTAQLEDGLRMGIAIYGPEVVAQETNPGTVLKAFLINRGVDADKHMKSDEQKQAESQQAQIMELVNQLGPNAINQIGGLIQQQQAQSQGEA